MDAPGHVVQQEPSKLQQGYTNIQACTYTHQLPWEVEPASCLMRAWLCLPDTVAQLQINTPPKNSRKVRPTRHTMHQSVPPSRPFCHAVMPQPTWSAVQATLNSNGQHYVHSSRPKTHHHLQQNPHRPRRRVHTHSAERFTRITFGPFQG